MYDGSCPVIFVNYSNRRKKLGQSAASSVTASARGPRAPWGEEEKRAGESSRASERPRTAFETPILRPALPSYAADPLQTACINVSRGISEPDPRHDIAAAACSYTTRSKPSRPSSRSVQSDVTAERPLWGKKLAGFLGAEPGRGLADGDGLSGIRCSAQSSATWLTSGGTAADTVASRIAVLPPARAACTDVVRIAQRYK